MPLPQGFARAPESADLSVMSTMLAKRVAVMIPPTCGISCFRQVFEEIAEGVHAQFLVKPDASRRVPVASLLSDRCRTG